MKINIVTTLVHNTCFERKPDGFGYRYVANNDRINDYFDTFDKVYLESLHSVLKLSHQDKIASATDFAIAQGCDVRSRCKTPQGKDAVVRRYLRSTQFNDLMYVINADGEVYVSSHPTWLQGVCPCMSIDIDSVLASESGKDYCIKDSKNSAGQGQKIMMIKELQFPQKKVDEKTARVLENLYSTGELKKTGKNFCDLQSIMSGRDDAVFEEYELNGKFYVRQKNWPHSAISEVHNFEDGTPVNSGEIVWIKVMPVKWLIRNWDDLPTTINPNGKGTAKTIKLRSEEALFAFNIYRHRPYQPISFEPTMWQNTEMRAYLNGINIIEELKNRNGWLNFRVNENEGFDNYDYTGRGFVNELDHSNLVHLNETKNNNSGL